MIPAAGDPLMTFAHYEAAGAGGGHLAYRIGIALVAGEQVVVAAPGLDDAVLLRPGVPVVDVVPCAVVAACFPVTRLPLCVLLLFSSLMPVLLFELQMLSAMTDWVTPWRSMPPPPRGPAVFPVIVRESATGDDAGTASGPLDHIAEITSRAQATDDGPPVTS